MGLEIPADRHRSVEPSAHAGEMPSAELMAEFLQATLKALLGSDVDVDVQVQRHVPERYAPTDDDPKDTWPKVRFPSLLDAAIVLEPGLRAHGANANGPGTMRPKDLAAWGIPPESRCSVCRQQLNPAVAHPRPSGTVVGSCCAEKPEAGEVFETTHEYLHWILSFCDEHTDSCGQCEGCKREAILRDRILALEAARS